MFTELRVLSLLCHFLVFALAISHSILAHEATEILIQHNGQPAFKHPLRVPIGIRDNTIHYVRLPTQTSLEELKELISEERRNAGFDLRLTPTEIVQLLLHAPWHIGAEKFVVAPVTARVNAIYVKAGQYVKVNEPIITLEVMKMNITLVANNNGVIHNIFCAVDNNVLWRDNIASILPDEAQWETINIREIEKNKDALISLFSSGNDDDTNGAPPLPKPSHIPSRFSLEDTSQFISIDLSRPQTWSIWFKDIYSGTSIILISNEQLGASHWHPHRLLMEPPTQRSIAKNKQPILPPFAKTQEHNITHPLTSKPKVKWPPLVHLVKYLFDESLKILKENRNFNMQPLSTDPSERLLQVIFGFILVSLIFLYSGNEMKGIKIVASTN